MNISRELGFVSKNAKSILKDLEVKNTETNVSVTTSSNNESFVSSTLKQVDETKLTSLSLKQNTIENPNKVSFFGFSFEAAKSETPKTSSKTVSKTEILNYKIDDQGSTNACGTTSLASVLNHFGVKVKDHWEIDKDVRSAKFDMYTTPKGIINYAEDKGFKAGLKNNSSIEDVAKYVDKGIPVMLFIDSSPSDVYDRYLHWIVIVGYERNEQGDINNVRVADPGYGSVYTESIEDLYKEWNDPKIGEDLPVLGKRTASTGYNNLMVVAVPKNKTITSPDGSSINTNSINVPNNRDTIRGYGAHIFGKGALLTEKTIDAASKVKDLISGTTSKIGSLIGF